MPVSGNETAIKSCGSQASSSVAGVPMKKRRFIWPSSPTPEEQSLARVENPALEKQNPGPSQESKPVVTSQGLSDTNEGFSLGESKKGSDHIVPTNSCINKSSFEIQEASFAIQSNSLAKADDDDKLATEKAADILTGTKPLGGVPMKKRRFVRLPSPPHEKTTLVLAANDSRKIEHDRQTAPSSASVGGSSVQSDLKNDLSAKNKFSDKVVQNGVVPSRVKLEEACPVFHSDSLAKRDNKKLLTPEMFANVEKEAVDSEFNLVSNKAAVLSFGIKQVVEGKSKGKSVASGNHELSLGLTGIQPSATENCSHDSHLQPGNVESLSLNLSLSNGETNSQHRVDQVQSNTDICDVVSDRLNWDLNTTMDAWEVSANDGAKGQVLPDGSNLLDTRNDTKPLMPIGVTASGFGTEKHIFDERECRTSFARTLPETGQGYNSEDSLHFRLTPSLPLFAHQVFSNLCANSRIAVPNSLPKELLLGSSIVSSRIVKSEPIEESVKNDPDGPKADSMPLLGFRAVAMKSEYVQKPAQEGLKLPNSSPGQPMKSEPIHQDNIANPKTTEGMSELSHKEVLQSHDAGEQCTSTSELIRQGQDVIGPLTSVTNEFVLQVQDTTGQSGCATDEPVLHGKNSHGKSNCSTDEQRLQGLSIHVHGPDLCLQGDAEGAHFKNEALKESCQSAEKIASEMSTHFVGHNGDEIKSLSAIVPIVAEEKLAGISDELKLNSKDEIPPVQYQTGECAVSDEEKINLSGDILEEECYGTEYESDGNSVPMEIEEDGRGQDDYEDGEVREPQQDAASDNPVCEKTENASCDDSDYKKASLEEPSGDFQGSFCDKGKNTLKEQPVEAKRDAIVDGGTSIDRETIDAEKDTSLKELPAVEISSDATDKREAVEIVNSNVLGSSVNKDESLGTEQSDQPDRSGQGTLIVSTGGITMNAQMNDAENDESMSKKVETSVNVDDAAKDGNSGGNQSRIINLSISSNLSSFGKARTISSKPFSLRSGRDRLPDIPLEGEKIHLRGREEAYTEGSHKFSRERYQDHSPRNSRWSFGRGRGRLGRTDSLRNDRDFERDCVPRHKYTSAVTGSDTEYMNYNIEQDGGFVNTARGGRKLLADEITPFRQFSARRRSPGARDGPPSRGLQMVRRGPRSIGEDNSEVVGVRHGEKMMRGFPDDSEEEHTYARPQHPFEGLDGPFTRGTRNFSNVHQRGVPQMRSKSPIRSRSPGPWSSRRRSPDGFGGPPELHHRRSPIYRMERIRSPNNPGFPTDRVPRRHGSPSYMTRSNELREMDHGHPRSTISNRTPNGRVLLRNNRRYNMVDPRERADNEEFFGGAGRFHELGDDGNGEDRRFNDRRAHVRQFRPSFNSGDGENFYLNSEECPRPFRYFPEDNPKFHEQRTREFDRRMKNRPGSGPRRPRSMEDEEGNYRHAGQVVNDEGFDDRVKRKRF